MQYYSYIIYSSINYENFSLRCFSCSMWCTLNVYIVSYIIILYCDKILSKIFNLRCYSFRLFHNISCVSVGGWVNYYFEIYPPTILYRHIIINCLPVINVCPKSPRCEWYYNIILIVCTYIVLLLQSLNVLNDWCI